MKEKIVQSNPIQSRDGCRRGSWRHVVPMFWGSCGNRENYNGYLWRWRSVFPGRADFVVVETLLHHLLYI